MTLEVVEQSLQSASDDAAAAEEQVSAIQLGSGPEKVSDALPGSASKEAAGKLADDWDAEIKALAKALGDYAQGLQDSLAQYRNDDEGSAAGFADIDLSAFGRV